MKNQTPSTNSLDPVRNSRNRPDACWTRAFLLIQLTIALVCVALVPTARAVCQDACLTNLNTVQGDDALLNNTGTSNTAIGDSALSSNTGGSFNTAIGALALRENTGGSSNTAIGNGALISNTDGGDNTATGEAALINNTTGSSNTANGFAALNLNSIGFNNTAIGTAALGSTTGNNNIGVGAGAGGNLTNGNNNIYIGSPAGNTGGVAAESGTIRIGTKDTHRNTLIAGISGATVPNGVAVIIDGKGHLGTTTSSARYKENIQPMAKASEAILALRPVTFRYKQELDPEGVPQFGLVAEDVEKVNPDLVAHDANGKAYTVRYEAVNAMLLNEFLKEHQKVQRLEAALAAVNERLKAQDAKIDKVNAKVELTKPAPQMVVNNQ
jgi:trimeric autotransporter adhesin